MQQQVRGQSNRRQQVPTRGSRRQLAPRAGGSFTARARAPRGGRPRLTTAPVSRALGGEAEQVALERDAARGSHLRASASRHRVHEARDEAVVAAEVTERPRSQASPCSSSPRNST
jgi:hypothetical protein